MRPIKIPGVSVEPQVVTPEEVKQMQCTKVVFLLLDFMDRWLREWQWQKGLEGITNEFYKKIKVLEVPLVISNFDLKNINSFRTFNLDCANFSWQNVIIIVGNILEL